MLSIEHLKDEAIENQQRWKQKRPTSAMAAHNAHFLFSLSALMCMGFSSHSLFIIFHSLSVTFFCKTFFSLFSELFGFETLFVVLLFNSFKTLFFFLISMFFCFVLFCFYTDSLWLSVCLSMCPFFLVLLMLLLLLLIGCFYIAPLLTYHVSYYQREGKKEMINNKKLNKQNRTFFNVFITETWGAEGNVNEKKH